MEFHTLTFTPAPPQPPPQQQHLVSMSYLWRLFHQVNAFHFILVLLCTIFGLAACGPCLMSGMQKSMECDACGTYGDTHGVSFQDSLIADTMLGHDTRSAMTPTSIQGICRSSHSFCFPSTLPGFFSEKLKLEAAALEVYSPLSTGSSQSSGWANNKNWSLDYGMFELLNGQTVSCSFNSKGSVDKSSSVQTDSANQNDVSSCRGPSLTQKSTTFRLKKNSEMMKSSPSDIFPSPHVEISPPVLDWGQKHLYFPSIAFLTVVNSGNDSNLHVYEPYSTNVQFYPCNFSEAFLGPGEVASICFVFLPRWLGLSSAHLILQTSSGGFLVQVKGHAIETPYKISPLGSLNVPSTGRISKNLSLFNSFDETLYLKEVNAWIFISHGNLSHHIEATCSLENFLDSDELSDLSIKDWLVIKSSQVGFPLMALRPHENWEIGPHSSETVLEIDFSFDMGGNIFGAFCMQLQRSSQNKSDTVMVPFEVDLDGNAAYDGVAGSVSVSVSLEALVSCDASDTVVAISLRNGAPEMLSVVKISEIAARKVFQIKYFEGLLLFPSTVTQVAVITCSQLLVELHDFPPDVSDINKNCELVVLTNDSSSSQIEIPCQDIIHICLKHQKDSSKGYDNQSGKAESVNRRTGSSDSSMQAPSHFEALETREADEFVLGNWKSQGTTGGMSVLDDHEVLFPMVQVGTHDSKWITVNNPSEQPVVMQLILNSGEIIDECRSADGFTDPPSSGSFLYSEFNMPTRYGFSVADSALTEAYVHPYGKASFGPIFFQPSRRCGWRSSALIRNNLSGVEWLSLRGFGGSLSLVLLEGSEPVQSINFSLNLPIALNITPPDILYEMGETAYVCSLPVSKELYAKNMGDLPLEVKSIGISGTECGLDGFMVHTCRGFSLEPGESTKLLISYQTDFSAVMVHRDLELSLASGLFAIPIKASLPLYMFDICKKSVFWMRLKKFAAAICLAASLMFLIYCYIFPQVIAFGSQDFSCKGEKSSVTMVRSAGKSSRMPRTQRTGKFSMSTDGRLTSVREKTLKQVPVGGYPDGQDEAPEHGITVQNLTHVENHEEINILSYAKKDKTVPSHSQSVAVEKSDATDPSQPCNLTVRTGKEKGRRRTKKKGVAARLTGLFEVSSSQSGNSTPSSPLSPVASLTPNRVWSPSSDMDQIEVRNPFIQVADRQNRKVQVSESTAMADVMEPKVSLKYSNNCVSAIQNQASLPRKTVNRPTLLPSATFPCAGSGAPNLLCVSPSLASKSKISPHARAPGSRLFCQRTDKEEEGMGNEYTYDIWGNHFPGLHVMDSSKDVTAMKTIATGNDSNSFFVRGPQALMMKSQQKSVQGNLNGCCMQLVEVKADGT